MSGKDDESKSSFADAVGDVKPLADRDKTAPPPRPRAKPGATAPPPASRRFFIERDGDWTWGRAEDVPERRLAELRAGRMPVEREIDLHGFAHDEAFLELREQVAAARRANVRCLLVIHGWGRRSPEGPVLKQALPGWLEAPPFADEVLAFATAPQAQGGVGATLVWLRRVRRR